MADEAVLRIVVQDEGNLKPSNPNDGPPESVPSSPPYQSPPQQSQPRPIQSTAPAPPPRESSRPQQSRQAEKPFDPFQDAQKQRESEVRRDQIKEAYERMYGTTKKTEDTFDTILDMATKMRGTLGGAFGPLVGSLLDFFAAIRDVQKRDERPAMRTMSFLPEFAASVPNTQPPAANVATAPPLPQASRMPNSESASVQPSAVASQSQTVIADALAALQAVGHTQQEAEKMLKAVTQSATKTFGGVEDVLNAVYKKTPPAQTHLATGGEVPQAPGIAASADEVPIKATAGEFVVNKDAAQQPENKAALQEMNRKPSSVFDKAKDLGTSLASAPQKVQEWAEKRYGRKALLAAGMFGQAATWGASALTIPTMGVPLPPGTGMVTSILAAEVAHRMKSAETIKQEREQEEANAMQEASVMKRMDSLPKFSDSGAGHYVEGGEVEFSQIADMKSAKEVFKNLGVDAFFGAGHDLTARRIAETFLASEKLGLNIPKTVRFDSAMKPGDMAAIKPDGGMTYGPDAARITEGFEKDWLAMEGRGDKSLSTNDPHHLYLHEIGHANTGKMSKSANELMNKHWDKERISKLVSKRAAADPEEFVAEVFAGKLLGKNYPPEFMQLFESLGGKLTGENKKEQEQNKPVESKKYQSSFFEKVSDWLADLPDKIFGSYAHGGEIQKVPGIPPNADEVPVKATAGEYIVNKEDAQANRPTLDAINSGQKPFATPNLDAAVKGYDAGWSLESTQQRVLAAVSQTRGPAYAGGELPMESKAQGPGGQSILSHAMNWFGGEVPTVLPLPTVKAAPPGANPSSSAMVQAAPKAAQAAAGGEAAMMAGVEAAMGPIGAAMAAIQVVKQVVADVRDGAVNMTRAVGTFAIAAADPDANPAKIVSNVGETTKTVSDKFLYISPALSIFGSVLGEATSSLGQFMNAVNATANRYGEFSAPIAQAQAFAEVQHTMGDLRRAQEAGPELARYIQMQGDLQQRFEDIKIKILLKILPVVTMIGNAVEGAMSAGEDISTAILTVASPLSAIVMALNRLVNINEDIRNPPPGDPTDLLFQVASADRTPGASTGIGIPNR